MGLQWQTCLVILDFYIIYSSPEQKSQSPEGNTTCQTTVDAREVSADKNGYKLHWACGQPWWDSYWRREVQGNPRMTDLGHLEQAEVISWALLLKHWRFIQGFCNLSTHLAKLIDKGKRVCFGRRTRSRMERAEEKFGLDSNTSVLWPKEDIHLGYGGQWFCHRDCAVAITWQKGESDSA